MTTRCKAGNWIEIGDVRICVVQTEKRSVLLNIEAPRDVAIKKGGDKRIEAAISKVYEDKRFKE